MKKLIAACLAVAVAGALATSAASAATVKIGLILTYSGPNAEPSEPMDKAVSLYVKTHAAELPAGTKVEIIRRDDTGANPAVAKRLAQELVTRDHVNFLAGLFWSPNTLAMAPIATEAKVPMVIMNASGSALTRASPYIVRFSWTVWQNAYPLGRWAIKQGWKTGYTLVSDYIPGHDGEAGFTKAFTDGGGKIVGAVRVPVNVPDYAPYLQRVRDAKPDVLFNFNPGGKEAPAFMKAWRELGFASTGIKVVATPDLVTDDELPNIGDSALGIVSAGPYSVAADRPANRAFLQVWRKAYGDASIPNNPAVASWDGMAAIYGVIKQTGGKFTGDQAMAILSHWKSDSPRGPISIDPATRDIVQNIYIRKVEKVNGRLENVEFETVPQVKDPWKELNPVKQ